VNVFFDIDDTIIASDDFTLRPLVREVFERLRADGHSVYVWSAKGKRWSDLDEHGLRDLVVDAFHKPSANFRKALKWMRIDVVPDFVVDDFPEIVLAFSGHTIKPYSAADPDDREMEVVYQKILAVAAAAPASPRHVVP
jgi:nucleoside-diphosphate-sugar epimerase